MKGTIKRAAVLATLVAGLVAPAAARAAAPSNDGFATASAIDPSSLPFSDTMAIDEATTEAGEPGYCPYGSGSQTIWYAFTPTVSGTYRVSIGSSFYYRYLAVYQQTGSGVGGLSAIACASWYYGSSSAVVSLAAGTPYYVQAGSSFSQSGSLTVSVEQVLPPTNDDFANAKSIASVPFSESVDTTAAGTEPGEPTPSCGYGQSAGTAWYAFTPSASGSYSASSPYSGFWPQVAVYTGSGLDGLSQIGCRTFGSLLTFRADAGSTYYLQVGGLFGGRGTLTLTLNIAPNPVAGFGVSPGDPSIFDTVQLYDFSYDPGQVGIASWSWDFGDGTSSTAQSPTHRYATDHTYRVELTVTTADGRTASSTRDLQVVTHDVAITKLMAPQTAGAGQTRQVTVGLVNDRYPENVRVVVEKSVAGGGWAPVGTADQAVPVRGPSRTTSFVFNYTFTPDDVTLGKVTFRATATILGARDAIPADNTAISLPTKVNA